MPKCWLASRFLRLRYLFPAIPFPLPNPVTARLCRRAEACPWSSAAAHLRGRNDGLVEVGPMLTLADDWDAYLPEPGDDAIAKQIRKTFPHRAAIGRRELPLVAGAHHRRILRRRRPGPKKSAGEK